ncbi:unnamed protein product [Brachionus calyciflorus]|uniref:Uncharacterized protein n=1 Tax=Brachionus calyciflorus TaxID=104777 RepID=A0A813Y0X8_9BILA|nr:unnamed protein product [Brachionus calyciflorus]
MKIGDLVKIQRSSGEFTTARVTDLTSVGANVVFCENGIETFKFIPRHKFKTNYSQIIFEVFRTLFISSILAIFANGIYNNYIFLEHNYKECQQKKMDTFRAFFLIRSVKYFQFGM